MASAKVPKRDRGCRAWIGCSRRAIDSVFAAVDEAAAEVGRVGVVDPAARHLEALRRLPEIGGRTCALSLTAVDGDIAMSFLLPLH